MTDYSLAEAAHRLGVTTEAMRARVKRKSLEGYRDNRGRWRVRLPNDRTNDRSVSQGVSGHLSGRAPPSSESEHDGTLVRLRERVAWLEGKLEGVEGRLSDREQELSEVKTERDRLLAMLEEAQAAFIRQQQGMFSQLRNRLLGSRKGSNG
jgi:hypothetical protein